MHRGTKEIGGTCVEVEADGQRIVLDLGLPLDASGDDAALLPIVPGLSDADPGLLAIVLSHGHRDHWGLIPQARPDLPVVMGDATRRIMAAAVPWVPGAYAPAQVVTMQDRVPVDLGPFRITPFLVDHSAYDAYALLVEAAGRRLFYSGDLRGHGRKAALFEKFVASPPSNIDVLLLEGTTLGRPETGLRFPTEADVEVKLTAEMKATSGMMLVCASAQNIDRMVSVYRAAKRAGRTMLIDVYAAEMLRATGNPNIPQSDWLHVALFTPHHQRMKIRDHSLFEVLDRHKKNRVFSEQLAGQASKLAMLFRPAMLRDLRRAACLVGARAVW
jgi:ribonuclease J